MKTGSLHAIVVKKTHSIKNNLLCTNNLRIVWLSSTYKGHVHDKKICDEEPLLLPKGIRFWQDTGFIGHKPDGVEICMPKKKPKGKELTCVEKQENKRISGVRIKVEHAIGGMKKCRIVKERFRCHKFDAESQPQDIGRVSEQRHAALLCTWWQGLVQEERDRAGVGTGI